MFNTNAFLTTLCILLSICSYAQDLQNFAVNGTQYNEDAFWGFTLTNGLISNKEAPSPEKHKLSAIVIGFDCKVMDFDKSGWSFHWHNKVFGDLLSELIKPKRESNSEESTTFTTGFLGCFDLTRNVTAGKMASIAVGLNANDHIIASRYFLDTVSGKPSRTYYLDPNGYHFSLGPTISYTFNIKDLVLLQARYAYSFSLWSPVSNRDFYIHTPDYPASHFDRWHVELQSKWGAYLHVDRSRLINRGEIPNKARRLDIGLGFRFKI